MNVFIFLLFQVIKFHLISTYIPNKIANNVRIFEFIYYNNIILLLFIVSYTCTISLMRTNDDSTLLYDYSSMLVEIVLNVL